MISPQKGGRDRVSCIEDPFQLCICATLFTGIYSDFANLSEMYDALSDVQLYEQTRTRYQLERVASPMCSACPREYPRRPQLGCPRDREYTSGVFRVWYFRFRTYALIAILGTTRSHFLSLSGWPWLIRRALAALSCGYRD